MSQLQVTGEAKIRDIQGPVVANSGVITALDGAASQYVRGDGTLADFPTSTGGGSSVSYYLNSSVSQGTIGGVAYRELSKEPIIGAGTDIAISANGYVANYITDVNDPDVLSVPGGNFNCEFYFSVNNNTGNPSFYAELYKYDGTTFTLLGSSVGVPEYINQGTTIAPYYFAIPVATAALALTDRLAIRIYVNVDGRTVTLHTENGHLCQVVTTFSKGMVSLNNLTDQSQFLTTGTSGTDFNIVSSGDTHTFNIPSASASNRGLINTGSQTIAGSKTFNNAINAESGVLLKNGFTAYSNSYTSLGGNIGNLIISGSISGTAFDNELAFTPSTSNTYEFPNLSGTLALLEGSQTFTGEKVFNNNALFNSVLSVNYGAWLQKGTPTATFSSAFTTLYSEVGAINAVFRDNTNQAKLQFQAASNYTYTFPASSGTIALLEGSQTFTGAKTFSASVVNDDGLKIKFGSASNLTANYLTLSAYGLTSPNRTVLRLGTTATTLSELYFSQLSSYQYTFPDASGTLALTSNLSSYLPLTGGTLTGPLSGTSATFSGSVTAGSFTDGFITMSAAQINRSGTVELQFGGAGDVRFFGSTSKPITFASTGAATFSSSVTAGNKITSGSGAFRAGGFYIPYSSASTASRTWAMTNDELAFGDFAILQSSTQTGGIDTYRLYISPTGNVGIGTSSPVFADGIGLQINNGAGSARLKLTNNTTGGTATDGAELALAGSDFYIGNNEAANFIFFTSLAERMRITSGGNVLIGTTADNGNRLQVNGSATFGGDINLSGGEINSTGRILMDAGAGNGFLFRCDNVGFTGLAISSNGLITIPSLVSLYTTAQLPNMWANPSDGTVSRSTASSSRFKDNIRDWDGNGLQTILLLKPKTFTYKADYYKNPELEMLGLIAEEVAEVSPFLAEFENEDRTGQVENVRYATIVVPLIKAVQELKAEIEELKALIAAK